MNSLDIARLIDHSILHPVLTDDDLKKHCEIALKYKVATVCVKPYHVKLASELLKGTDTAICAVVGFPHGNSTIEIKEMETMQVCMDGASEVDMVINIGKVLQNDWDYIKNEIRTINNACRKYIAILKVIFENDFLTDDHYKIKLCEICNSIEVAFIKTSTGFGFAKNNDGLYSYKGATIDDLKLMSKYISPHIQIKAAGAIRTLDQLLMAIESGATRIGTSSTIDILEEANLRFKL